MNESKKNGEIEIDLVKVGKAIKKFWALLLTFTLVFGVIGYLVSSFVMTKKYEASVKMIVNTSANADRVSSDELNSAKSLVSTYSFIITGSTVLQKVIEDLHLDMTYEELSKCLSVNAVNDTQVFTVTAVTDDVETSKNIIREIIKIAPGEIENAVEAGSCNVVSDLDYLTTPVSPDVVKITAAAAIIGLLLALGIALFRVLSKSYIVTENDVVEQLDVPVLGVIPLL